MTVIYISQELNRPIKVGEKYGFSVWLRSENPMRAWVNIEARAYPEEDVRLSGPALTSEGRSRYSISSEWKRYTTTVVVEEGKASKNGYFRVIVDLFENPGTRVEIDDAQFLFLGVQEP